MVFVVEKFPLFLEAARDYNPRIMSHSNPRAETVEEAVANDRHFGLHIELEYPNKGDRYIIDPDTKRRDWFFVGNVKDCQTSLRPYYFRAVEAKNTIYWQEIARRIRAIYSFDINELMNPTHPKFSHIDDTELLRLMTEEGVISEVNSSVVLSAIDPEFRAAWGVENKRPLYLTELLEKLLPPLLVRRLGELNQKQFAAVYLMRGQMPHDGIEQVGHILDLVYLAKYIHEDDGRIIDACCGTGVVAIVASQLTGHHIIAIDKQQPFITFGREFAHKNGIRVIEWKAQYFEKWASKLRRNDMVIAYKPAYADERIVEETARVGNNLILFPSETKMRAEHVMGWDETPRRLEYFRHRLQQAGLHAYLFLSGLPQFHIRNQNPQARLAGILPAEALADLPEGDLPNYTLLATKRPLAIPDENMGIIAEKVIRIDKPTYLDKSSH